MAKPPVSEHVQVNFRMPADLRTSLKAAADQNGRSMSSEIIARLQDSFAATRSDPIVDASGDQLVASLLTRALQNPEAKVEIFLANDLAPGHDSVITKISARFSDNGQVSYQLREVDSHDYSVVTAQPGS